MVAYSFQRRFVNPIRAGFGLDPLPDFPPAAGPKRHTIRSPRVRGHAHEGQPLELFFAQRTRACFLIARAVCTGVAPITLVFDADPEAEGVISPGFGIMEWGYDSLDAFAVGDGFKDWAELKNFWTVERGSAEFAFKGNIIFWEANQTEEHRCAA
jgi:hypothetical protein